MSSLTVYHQANPNVPNKLLTHGEDIAATLAEIGIDFLRVPADAPIAVGASEEEVLVGLGSQLEVLKAERGHAAAEVLSLHTARRYEEQAPKRELVELCNRQTEARWFVAGYGVLNMHVGDYIYAVRGEQNDLLSLPAGTRHWLDVGDYPNVVAVRLHASGEEGRNRPTGDDIASRFPRLED